LLSLIKLLVDLINELTTNYGLTNVPLTSLLIYFLKFIFFFFNNYNYNIFLINLYSFDNVIFYYKENTDLLLFNSIIYYKSLLL
jgi:hypothetical protein